MLCRSPTHLFVTLAICSIASPVDFIGLLLIRVKNVSGRDRLSCPFFFDPNFNAELHPIEIKGALVDDNLNERWDKASVHEFRCTYGDYVLNKVAKVFPQLRQEVF